MIQAYKDPALLKMVRGLLEEELLRRTPKCPKCRMKMKKCTAHETGRAFWGCRRFPDCKGYQGMRVARVRDQLDASLKMVSTMLAQLLSGANVMEEK